MTASDPLVRVGFARANGGPLTYWPQRSSKLRISPPRPTMPSAFLVARAACWPPGGGIAGQYRPTTVLSTTNPSA